MSYTAPSVRKLDVGVGTDHQVLCSEFAKIATEIGNDQALASGKIIVGNASGVATDVTMSGDATLASTGALTIASGAVEESMLAAANTEGLHAARVARAVYDFSVDGGIIGDIALGATLPDKARVTRSWCEVITPLTSATNAATVAISIPENDVAGIFAAIAINDVSNPWAVGIHVGIQDGVIANISEKCTAARALTMTIDVEALMAGKIVFFAEYVVSA